MRPKKRTADGGRIGLRTSTAVHLSRYLGSIMSIDGGTEADVNCRIGKAAAAFQQMRSVWSTSTIDTATKIRLFNAIIVPTAIYASETWKFTAKVAKKINVFQQRCLRKILRVS